MDIVTVMQAYCHPKDIFILYAMCFEIIRYCFEKPNSILHCYSALLHFPAGETLDFKLAGNRYPGDHWFLGTGRMSARPDPASWFDTISDILRRLADLQETGFITDITDAE
jgi:hypothetical protein